MAGRVASTGRIQKDWTPSLVNDSGVTTPLWLKADTGVTLTGGTMTGWADQGGLGNNARQDLDMAAQPAVGADAYFSGLTSVQFNATAAYGNPTGYPNGTNPCTVFNVLMLPVIAGSRMYLHTNSAEFGIYAEATTGELGIYCNAFKATGLILRPKTPYIVEVAYDGTSVFPKVNGVAGTTGSGFTLVASSAQYTIGGLSPAGGVNDPQWSLAEHIVFKGTLSAATATKVRNYLNAKYRVY